MYTLYICHPLNICLNSRLYVLYKQTLEKTENAIKYNQSRDTGNIGQKTQNEDNNT
jgi:hypothetical protein